MIAIGDYKYYDETAMCEEPANQGYYIQVGLRMTSWLAGLIFAIQKGSVKHNSICLC